MSNFADVKLLSLSLLLGILIQVSGSLFINLAFLANKSYVVKELCVEKDLEVNTCQGSCHLDKSLEDQESGDPGLTESSVLLAAAPLVGTFEMKAPIDQGEKRYEHEPIGLRDGFCKTPFHPPRWS